MPKSLAWLPATRILPAFFGRGSKGAEEDFPFFRRTRDFLTASRANSRCSYIPRPAQLDASVTIFSMYADEHDEVLRTDLLPDFTGKASIGVRVLK